MRVSRIAGVATVGSSALLALTFCTWISIQSIAEGLPPVDQDDIHVEFSDRLSRPLSVSYQNRLNHARQKSLSLMPRIVVDAFILSEDKRFFSHGGIDWRARAHAVWQALRYRGLIRGASSISEQVVRILHPRPRTAWTRWIEGFEALSLESHYSKSTILEFYLNQVPYGARRRGVTAAAHYYFDRDLSTLNPRELIALAVMVRAPERLNPRRNSSGLSRRIDQLIGRMHEQKLLSESQVELARNATLELRQEREPAEAGHFVRFLRQHQRSELLNTTGTVRTTLDGTLQAQVQQGLKTLLRKFADNQIDQGAALVIDHERGEILAWVNDRSFSDQKEGSQIDAVLAERQPGSTLKPFVYAEALEREWDAATILDDRELSRQVGSGLHRYRNYSRTFHGKVRLREALGNSLNIPAIRAAEYVGRSDLLLALRSFGFDSLRRNADHYGEGLALGNGEVSLFELVSAYAVLARGGERISIRGIAEKKPLFHHRVISPETASIIADILADPQARMLEFGRGGVLQFPTETAVKTGTSSGYRDLWAVGFSARFTAGVWMGNLNRRPTRGLTSSQAPAILLRSIFALLEQRWDGAPLPKRGDLVERTICAETGLPPVAESGSSCRKIDELFAASKPARESSPFHPLNPQILVPSPGLVIARDPRVSDAFEKLGLSLDQYETVNSVRWYVDSQYVGEATADRRTVTWPLEPGKHQVSAEMLLDQEGGLIKVNAGPVPFFVR